jgi:hypothetical protein
MGMHQEHQQSTWGLFFCLLKESLAVVDAFQCPHFHMHMHQDHHQSTWVLFFCLLKESLAVVDVVVVGYTYMFLEKVMILVCNRIEYLVQGE